MGLDVAMHAKSTTDGLFIVRKTRQHNLEAQLKKQQAALDKQKTGLNTFRTALQDLGKTDEGLLKNTGSSIKEVASISANEKAVKGSYSFFVEQLATKHQLAYTGITDDLVKAEQGALELTVDGKPLNVELKSINTVADLASAINSSKDNPGVTASVVRSNGQQILLLTSDKSGKANQITLGGNRPAIFARANETTLNNAQDSVIYIGDKSNGLKVESSSNTLDKVIDGVTINLIKVQKPGDPLLEVNVEVEQTETEAQIKKFIDAFNSAKSAVKSNDRSDSLSAAVKQSLNSLAAKSYNGKNLGMIGVSFDRNGVLKLDSKKITEVLKNSPASITELLSGPNGLIKKLDKALDPYLSPSDGLLKSRSEMLAMRKTALESNKESLEKIYQRVLKVQTLKYDRLSNLIDNMMNTINTLDQQANF
ncbi:flagellar filament capping protein FliD [Yersinia enterocolitica]|uniref:Flagellar hook-associated protein 2 n=1 Tax=Yersinia enterocolitica subsp. palearctica serotype O:3 (strain DSM 13030 / CIP 106945 / Y11) TaxID=930944 RepID=A0A0H3NN27_YERE1|nr:flagellar filament capping protein FliD [Yersinia enterocolitica]EKN3313415.1 flagellar filament capping protein FliD [Yersinia enterocolitica]EKN3316713.1 flagellar filament capping protein FliD [Yersinia enterocolitica]EKN3320840.1 flagellar filament capping protein FliD [Yersinia enterocolitica]EKN3332690.1 flagellar filament capping protein FliD [Yersinia enterocolitica]EKN3352624.1 flagellar filament capping protein FliD [Yersinia enterocolitica]